MICNWRILFFTKADLLQLKLIHLFASELFLMKKMEIQKAKPTVIVSKTLSALRQFPSREICSPDIFSRQTLSAMRVKDTFSPETLSVATISALRHLRLRETFSRETLSALRHLRLRETFSWEKLSVGRNFQPREQLGDTFNPETISASRHFQPQNIFSLEKL